MSLSIVNTRAKLALKAPLVSVEVHLSNGLPAFNKVCQLNTQQRNFLDKAINRYSLSARGYHRLLKVARSIADLSEIEIPDIPQYQEALSYGIQFNAAK